MSFPPRTATLRFREKWRIGVAQVRTVLHAGLTIVALDEPYHQPAHTARFFDAVNPDVGVPFARTEAGAGTQGHVAGV